MTSYHAKLINNEPLPLPVEQLATMATTIIPGQPQRWGNESTNFYQASYTSTPGVASRQKVYRCSDSQYANSGNFHNGTKAINL